MTRMRVVATGRCVSLRNINAKIMIVVRRRGGINILMAVITKAKMLDKGKGYDQCKRSGVKATSLAWVF